MFLERIGHQTKMSSNVKGAAPEAAKHSELKELQQVESFGVYTP